MDQFRKKVYMWWGEVKSRYPRPAESDEFLDDSPPLEFLPARPLTPAEKYARLAAIHDVIGDWDKPICSDSPISNYIERRRAGMAYYILRRLVVTAITDEDRLRIERILDDVQADLAEADAPTPSDRSADYSVPPLDIASGQWIRATCAAQMAGITTRTLSKYRCDGQVSDDGMVGIDRFGRTWRRQRTKTSHPWYLRSSVEKPAGKP